MAKPRPKSKPKKPKVKPKKKAERDRGHDLRAGMVVELDDPEFGYNTGGFGSA